MTKKLKRFERSEKKKRFWRIITTILPRGFCPCILHGLTKIHKSKTDLCPSLQPIPFSNKHTIKQTSKVSCSNCNTSNPKWFLLAEEVQSFDSAQYLTSCNMESLFTNFPLEETINICVNKRFTAKTKVNNSTLDSFLIFHEKYHKHIIV